MYSDEILVNEGKNDVLKVIFLAEEEDIIYIKNKDIPYIEGIERESLIKIMALVDFKRKNARCASHTSTNYKGINVPLYKRDFFEESLMLLLKQDISPETIIEVLDKMKYNEIIKFFKDFDIQTFNQYL